jgi:hypothetical protein
MSAFIVDDKTFALIASGLCNLKTYSRWAKQSDPVEVRKLVEGWSAANCEAIKQRYGDENKPIKLPKRLPSPPSAVQLVKSLQCLSYQCSEGDVGEGCYVDEMKALHGTISELCEMIVHNLPEYEAAEWG